MYSLCEFLDLMPPKKNSKLSAVRLRRLSVRQLADSLGDFLAACGGENRPNYFKNRPFGKTARAISRGDCSGAVFRFMLSNLYKSATLSLFGSLKSE